MDRKTILVTGASSGIGAAVAELLSATHKIILCGRNLERLQDVKQHCNGNDHIIWQFDLSNVIEIEGSLTEFIRQNNLSVNSLVNCAGMIKYIPVKQFKPYAFEEIFNVNVVAPAMLVKVLASRRVNNSNLETVVLISSNISNFGAKAHCLYSSSKAALDGLMRSLAVELAPHTRVNSILPGAVETRMTSQIYANQELVDKMLSSYPLGRGMTTDIAKAVKFLCEDDSRWITGQQLTVDGGRTVNLSV